MWATGTRARRATAEEPAADDFDALWRRVIGPVEPFLEAVGRQLKEQVETFDPEVAPYARYALTNQGKQLRPALVALSAESVGGLDDRAVKVAVIIEMIHLATLVHDDVMDEASMRRRRPTLAANWGNSLSVLLGDCLFAHALRLASSFPTTDVCRAVSAATKTVCSGEILQTLRRGQLPTSRTEYFRILQMKTAELFALSCDLGGWLCGTEPNRRAGLRRFGMDLGTAYQIFDDCVDIFGSELAAGKSLGTDLANGKWTLPLLVLLERAEPGEAEEVRRLISHWDAHHVARIHDLLETYSALDECRRVIHGFLKSAREALRVLPQSSAREGLEGLTGFLAQQTDELGVQPSA